MPKEYKGESLPMMAAAPGNPSGKAADDDVTFNGVVVVKKGQYYNPVYLAAIEEGCKAGKPLPKENKAAQPSENK